MKNQLTTLLVCLFLAFQVSAQQASQWRGPNGNGVYEAPDMLPSWPADGPNVLWSFDGLGEGFSSPAFANGKIYCSGMIDGIGYVFVLDQQGKEITRMKYGNEFTSSYPGARSTPTVVGDLVYMLSGNGILVCMDANTGATKWSKNLFKDFDGKNITWGITESVVVDGDVVFCSPGGKTNNVVALNRFNGDLIWSCKGLGELSAYCTPLLVKLPDRKILVNMMADHIIGVDAATGKLLWSESQTNRWSVHANTPIYANNGLFCFSG
ncbi:MAG TPA: PQQ-binding-like beta-propeller repeat protein, partial [Sunxiuqinia sp.]|nr:PQQ-binding-like beta-propeller repeat protein [Sunxiuqinia sp.]